MLVIGFGQIQGDQAVIVARDHLLFQDDSKSKARPVPAVTSRGVIGSPSWSSWKMRRRLADSARTNSSIPASS